MRSPFVRAIFRTIGLLAAWMGGATVVGAIVATIYNDHGSVVFLVLAWYAGLAGAAIHLLVRIVGAARRDMRSRI
jgi:hypothetical protein